MPETQHSVLNDETYREYGLLMITEPRVFRFDQGEWQVTPQQHSTWIPVQPKYEDRERRPRAMIWVHKDMQFQELETGSRDAVAVMIKVGGETIVALSVYVGKKTNEEDVKLKNAIENIDKVIQEARQASTEAVEILVTGDFNRHDQLWGGDAVARTPRQGEGTPIIDMMAEHDLQGLLPRGTVTWQSSRGHQSTIDLTLASAGLTERLLKCTTDDTAHGSDHLAIDIEFDLALSESREAERKLWKHAKWEQLRETVANELATRPRPDNDKDLNVYAQYILDLTTVAVQKHVPVSRPCKYAKRWWTEDLTKLRKDYTYWRNQARAVRRNGQREDGLEEKAKAFKKRFHDAARKQRSNHWQDFVEDANNIWDIAKYAKPDAVKQPNRIPALRTATGKAETAPEIAECLLTGFFPPLPEVVQEPNQADQVEPLLHIPLTKDEVKAAIFSSHPYKAPGMDDLPAIVWQKLWPELGEHVFRLFELSLDLGRIPDNWRVARIVPLRKPGKPDYTVAKAYRPISLLSTLGKAMEGVVAERLSYLVETHNLLPRNHFGARKNRSTVQALTVLQESIYNAWREGKVLSMVSFDVKGAYNGVNIGVLEHRLRRRRIPEQLISWIVDFCSHRKASVMVNGHVTEIMDILQAGLPQGSKVSPILFLFFNADLVASKLNRNEGAMAFVDDFTAWVTGKDEANNTAKLQETVIPKAERWEKTSGATFEADKTSFIHFTRREEIDMSSTLTMKGELICPQGEVKVLGVILDRKLRFKAHMARAAKKGTNAALALKRVRGTNPKTARRLFTALVAPSMDYASPIWSGGARQKDIRTLNVAQRIGAQAIVGAFRTVSLARAEAEASVTPLEERLQRQRNLFWIKANTLPDQNPLARIISQTRPWVRRYTSPLMEIAQYMEEVPAMQLRTSQPFCIAPWQGTLEASLQASEGDRAWTPREKGLYIYSVASYKKGNIGVGVYHEVTSRNGQIHRCRRSLKIGNKAQAPPAEIGLQAIDAAVDFVVGSYPPRMIESIRPKARSMEYTVVSSNRAAVQAIQNTRKAPHQALLRTISLKAEALRIRGGPQIKIQWVPKKDLTCDEAKEATQLAKFATASDLNPIHEKSLSAARRQAHQLVKQHAREMNHHLDTALPGKHTKEMYDQLTGKQAAVLCQLRTGMNRLKSYLSKIKVSDTALCECDNSEVETIAHFLFECPRWEEHRDELKGSEDERWKDLSYFVGGRTEDTAPNGELIDGDRKHWAPNMEVVKRTIEYAMKTGRLH
jgi:hypothetical protein